MSQIIFLIFGIIVTAAFFWLKNKNIKKNIVDDDKIKENLLNQLQSEFPESFNSLSSDDKNIEIEVKVISFNPWSREIRGQQRQMGFGMIEEDPWGKSNSRERLKYTDWGNHSETMKPGSIILSSEILEYPR